MSERETLTHLKTLIRVAMEADDIEKAQRLLKEIQVLVSKALADSA